MLHIRKNTRRSEQINCNYYSYSFPVAVCCMRSKSRRGPFEVFVFVFFSMFVFRTRNPGLYLCEYLPETVEWFTLQCLIACSRSGVDV